MDPKSTSGATHSGRISKRTPKTPPEIFRRNFWWLPLRPEVAGKCFWQGQLCRLRISTSFSTFWRHFRSIFLPEVGRKQWIFDELGIFQFLFYLSVWAKGTRDWTSHNTLAISHGQCVTDMVASYDSSCHTVLRIEFEAYYVECYDSWVIISVTAWKSKIGFRMMPHASWIMIHK